MTFSRNQRLVWLTAAVCVCIGIGALGLYSKLVTFAQSTTLPMPSTSSFTDPNMIVNPPLPPQKLPDPIDPKLLDEMKKKEVCKQEYMSWESISILTGNTWSVVASAPNAYSKLSAECQTLLFPNGFPVYTGSYVPSMPDPKTDPDAFNQRRLDQANLNKKIWYPYKWSSQSPSQKKTWNMPNPSPKQDPAIKSLPWCTDMQVFAGRTVNRPLQLFVWTAKKMKQSHNALLLQVSAQQTLNNGKPQVGGIQVDMKGVLCDGKQCICDGWSCKQYPDWWNTFGIEMPSYKASKSDPQNAWMTDLNGWPVYPDKMTFAPYTFVMLDKNNKALCTNTQSLEIDLTLLKDGSNPAYDMLQPFVYASPHDINNDGKYVPGKPGSFSKTLILPSDTQQFKFSSVPLYKMYRQAKLINQSDQSDMYCNGCQISFVNNLQYIIATVIPNPWVKAIQFGFNNFKNQVPYKVALGDKDTAPLLLSMIPEVVELSSTKDRIVKIKVYANKRMKKMNSQTGRWSDDNFFPDFGSQIQFGGLSWITLAKGKFYGRGNKTAGGGLTDGFAPVSLLATKACDKPQDMQNKICANNGGSIIYRAYDLVIYVPYQPGASSDTFTVTIPAWVAYDLAGNPNQEASITLYAPQW